MGHTPTGTKAKSYKVNTPESKAIGNITENMLKTSALNLGTGTVNNLFSGYGLNTPTLDLSNEGVKVYDGHKSDFKFNEDALKEIVKPRAATAEEINLAKQTAITKTKAEQLQQIDLDIGIEKKQRELTQEKLKRVPLDQEALTKKIQEDETKKLLKKKLKEEGNLIPNPENTIPEEDVKKLKAQGLWDTITKGLKQIPIAGALYAGMSQYAESAEAGDPTGVSIAKGALEVIPPVTPSDIKDVETVAKKGAESLVEKSMESGDSNVGFVQGLMGQFGYPSGGGFSSGGFINKNEIRR